MKDEDMNKKLDYIAGAAKSNTPAEVLNAIHACRPGHPLGRGLTLKRNLENASYAAYHWMDSYKAAETLRNLMLSA